MLNQSHQARIALGGPATIVLVTEADFDVDTLFASLWQEIFLFENRFSRFLIDSELSQFNRKAGLQLPISQAFHDLLQCAQKLSQSTGGLYNPFILPALQKAGYSHSALEAYKYDPVDDVTDRSIVGIDKLQIGDQAATIPYGTALDLGGCGKGYLADVLADKIDKTAVHGYWISLSGDMVTSGYDSDNKPWQTHIQSAQAAESSLQTCIQSDGRRIGIATSGTSWRPGQKMKSKQAHHIIDPRSGEPADSDLLLATIVASTCVEADVLASCAIILGAEAATAQLQRTSVTSFVLQTKQNVIESGPLLHKHTLNMAATT